MHRWRGAPEVTENGEDYILVPRAAEEFQIPKENLYYWIRKGLLPAYERGISPTPKYIKRSELRELLKMRPARPSNPNPGDDMDDVTK